MKKLIKEKHLNQATKPNQMFKTKQDRYTLSILDFTTNNKKYQGGIYV